MKSLRGLRDATFGLVACVNVANLLVGRSITRPRELAIRAALGSGRGRLVRQLLTESLILSVSSAATGALLAVAAVRSFELFNPIEMPAGSTVAVNTPVLAFAGALAALTAVLFGFVPAWNASGVALNAVLSSGSRAVCGAGRRRLATMLVAVVVMLSLTLLVGAGLLTQSALRFAGAPLGIDAENLFRMSVSLLPSVRGKPEQRIAFYRELLDDAAAAGLRDACLSTAVPVSGGRGSNVLVVEGRPEPTPQTAVTEIAQQFVSPQYFGCTGVPLLRGRRHDDRDAWKALPVGSYQRGTRSQIFSGSGPVWEGVSAFQANPSG